MSDLINRNKLLVDIFEAYEREYPTAAGAFDEFATRIVPNVIKQQPAIDAVPVVRCKKCIYRNDKTHYCPQLGICVEDTFYCGDGE